MKPDSFERRRVQQEQLFRQMQTDREAQVDRWLGWIFTAAFVLMLVIVALGAAAVRWLWLHAS